MKKFFKEFKEFALKGNVMNLAVGVILGAAINKIVGALVDNMLMPLVGIVIGGIDFNSLAVTIGSATLKYGVFIQAVIEFFITAVSIFAIVKLITYIEEKGKKALKLEKEKAAKEEDDKPKSVEDYLKEIVVLLTSEDISKRR